jgi:hypothetical protein
MNYKKLMELNPTSYGKMTNELNQEIEFFEHPLKGDEHPVICVCHQMEVAQTSEFFETSDMMEDHKEYQPWFDENKVLNYGY